MVSVTMELNAIVLSWVMVIDDSSLLKISHLLNHSLKCEPLLVHKRNVKQTNSLHHYYTQALQSLDRTVTVSGYDHLRRGRTA